MLSELKAKHRDSISLKLPSSESAIRDAERALKMRLPTELGDALRESDGFAGEYGTDLLWPISRIVAHNMRFRRDEEFRKLYMPFDSLLFFADAGNGDQFAFAILNGQVRRSDIYAWNHEDDSRTWVAPSLQRFYDWWMTGKIST